MIALEGTEPPVVGRVGADDCPESLMPGERVSVRFIVGVMVRWRARAARVAADAKRHEVVQWNAAARSSDYPNLRR